MTSLLDIIIEEKVRTVTIKYKRRKKVVNSIKILTVAIKKFFYFTFVKSETSKRDNKEGE